jgi:hypothetical protein
MRPSVDPGSPARPELHVIGHGATAYVWVGDVSVDRQRCYATLDGSGLKRLAARFKAPAK